MFGVQYLMIFFLIPPFPPPLPLVSSPSIPPPPPPPSLLSMHLPPEIFSWRILLLTSTAPWPLSEINSTSLNYSHLGSLWRPSLPFKTAFLLLTLPFHQSVNSERSMSTTSARVPVQRMKRRHLCSARLGHALFQIGEGHSLWRGQRETMNPSSLAGR